MIRQRLLVLAVLPALVIPSFAQRRGGTSPGASTTNRTSDLNVRVALQNDRPVEKGVEVTLLASGGGIVQQVFTDDIGAAAFHGISPGRYRLRISGIDVETIELPMFEISPLESVHYEYVHVAAKGDNTNSGAGGGAMISAAELNIPDKAKKEFDRGIEAMQKSENDKALEHFEKATAIYPQYSQAYNNIGVIEVREGQMMQARQAFETAVSLNPKSASGYLNLARMSLSDKHYPEADQLISKALTAEPNRVDAVALAAQAKLMMGDMDAAYAYAKKVHGMGDHKAYSAVHLICASVLERRHQTEQAVAEYKMFLSETPDSPTAPRIRDEIARLGGSEGK